MNLNINMNKNSLENNDITELLNFFETLDKQDIIGLLKGDKIVCETSTGLKIKVKKQ